MTQKSHLFLLGIFLATSSCGSDDAGEQNNPVEELDGGDSGFQDSDAEPDTETGIVETDSGAETDSGTEPDSTETDSSDEIDSDPDSSLDCDIDEFGDLSFGEPFLLEEDSHTFDANTCGGDDWFQLDLEAMDVLLVSVDYDISNERAINAYLVKENFVELVRGESDDFGNTSFRVTILEDGPYFLRIYEENNEVLDYSTTITISDEYANCREDFGEPNNEAEEAVVISIDQLVETQLCPGDVDWYQIDVPNDALISATVEFSNEVGDLDVDLWLSAATEPEVVSNTRSDVETVYYGPVRSRQFVWIRVYGYEGANGPYTLEVTSHSGDPVDLTITGSMAYEDRIFDENSFTGEIVENVSADVEVEIIRELDQALIETIYTDENGEFSVDITAHEGFAYFARALSHARPVNQSVVVRDRSDNERLYAQESTRFVATSESSPTLEMIARAEDPTGGAFNIIDVARKGYVFIAEHTDDSMEELTFSWQPGMPFDCGSCYTNSQISLAGGEEDTDEYDDDIILHEFGHYFVDLLSKDDNPGGSHDGAYDDPLLAFGEGLATFFSSLVQDDPFYVDNYEGSHRLRDIELAEEDPDQYYGTSDDTLSGDVSEYLVSAILWDFYDPISEEEPFDQIDGGSARSMELLLQYLPDCRNVGILGVDLADWINGASCYYSELVQPLITLAEQREFPWTDNDMACEKQNHSLTITEQNGILLLEGFSPEQTQNMLGFLPLPTFVQIRTRFFSNSTFFSETISCEIGSSCFIAQADPSLHIVISSPDSERVGASWIGAEAAEQYVGGILSEDGLLRSFAPNNK